MKKKFADIQNSDFPGIDPSRFQEWKEAGLTFRKNADIYGIIAFLSIMVILSIIFQRCNLNRINRFGNFLHNFNTFYSFEL
jgi:hypothetical protein